MSGRESITEQDANLTMEQMDALVASVKEAKNNYEQAKKVSDDLYAVVEEAKARLIEAMEASERDSYLTKDGTRISVSYAMSVQTPKSVDEKRAFFDWLRKNKGDEVADAYMTVNSNSLNSLYNELTEEWNRKGEMLMIDGLGEPVARKKLSIRG